MSTTRTCPDETPVTSLFELEPFDIDSIAAPPTQCEHCGIALGALHHIARRIEYSLDANFTSTRRGKRGVRNSAVVGVGHGVFVVQYRVQYSEPQVGVSGFGFRSPLAGRHPARIARMSIRHYCTITRALLALVIAGCASSGCASSGGAKATGERVQPVRALPSNATPVPASDGMPAGFGVAFAAADARARGVLYWQQCAATVLRLRASGTFGTAAVAPHTVYCVRTTDGVPVGGVFDIDTGYARARRLTLVRLDGARPRYTGRIDTVRVAQEARFVRDVTREIAPVWRQQRRLFTVVPLLQNEGTLEGWVMPVSAQGGRTAVLGGDVALVRAANGSLRRIVDRSATWTLITIPATGPVQLRSAERDVAAVSDLALARSALEARRP